MEDKKALSPLSILSMTCISIIESIILILDASRDSEDSEHISFDDGLSDNIYFDVIGCEFERDLEGKLRNRVTEKRHRDNSDW
ncbi:hypothetical protein QNE88_003636 [Vibrio alginolyticus]|uniref:hypothetical protein n=1 Tax=Vibrio TaxID=662 RepID=UPI00197CB5FC|nr:MULTISPECIES: hypothetical protein [Vibrio]EGR2743676.1 hypothetical protein [Vibrio parahaemolyticus]EGQ7841500.1 hypothetical protein [Vibrio alginolyticus]EGR0303793.1 hypothetical protein [Vibrio alginolyticus]EGR2874946.1 hypothetical protein [Vibrio parahaemolyticus]EJC7065945.1 hypothetical protein [Vibrio parahaemolyticus]